MDNSENPKIGYKIKTRNGYCILSPETAFAIYMENLIGLYEEKMGKKTDVIILRNQDTVFSECQKEAILNVSKTIEKDIIFV